MRFWSGFGAVAGCLVLSSFASAATITQGGTSITMDFVTVGDAGNHPDSTRYDAVGYDFSIGKYEVTADQWAAVIAADSNVGNAGNWTGLQPTAGTSWYEAAKFCNWLTSGDASLGVYTFTGSITNPTDVTIDRSGAEATYGTIYYLPTEDEWYKAAYYDPNKEGTGVGGYWRYPTGSDTVPDGIDFQGDTTFDAVFGDGYNQRHPNNVTNSGIASPYGTIGQGGNVWEWNETAIGSHRGCLGGAYAYPSGYLSCYTWFHFPPTTESAGIGFRVASNSVAAVPEPGSLLIWACGSLGAFVLRRRRR